MSLPSYPELARKIREKTRGRKFEVKVNDSPELWAKFKDRNLVGDIQVWYENLPSYPVATLREDNSLTIDIHGWHTQVSVKIIEALSSTWATTNRNHIWVGRAPIDGLIEFNDLRYYVMPEKYQCISDLAYDRIGQVTIDDLPPKHRMMYELGTWNPPGAVTQAVKDYCRGVMGKDKLSPRDILSIMSACPNAAIIQKLFEEAV